MVAQTKETALMTGRERAMTLLEWLFVGANRWLRDRTHLRYFFAAARADHRCSNEYARAGILPTGGRVGAWRRLRATG